MFEQRSHTTAPHSPESGNIVTDGATIPLVLAVLVLMVIGHVIVFVFSCFRVLPMVVDTVAIALVPFAVVVSAMLLTGMESDGLGWNGLLSE